MRARWHCLVVLGACICVRRLSRAVVGTASGVCRVLALYRLVEGLVAGSWSSAGLPVPSGCLLFCTVCALNCVRVVRPTGWAEGLHVGAWHAANVCLCAAGVAGTLILPRCVRWPRVRAPAGMNHPELSCDSRTSNKPPNE